LADHPADERVDRDQQRELGQVLPQPEPDRFRVALLDHVPVASARPLIAAQSSGPPTSTANSLCPACSRTLAPVIARSPCPHMTTSRPEGTSHEVGSAPSSTLLALGTWPVRNSSRWRTSSTAAAPRATGSINSIDAAGSPDVAQVW